ncbi:hypothetical protein TcasGA2_TC034676 [Tribolium castaneum]|uniref:Uncharacterized protein n=1 Tax=Tribolium castaneum TaxID=7070 RepID=A0A139WIQ5_TRICA|nr:hypothetical protein TcasGA2_TC034676 [Tribolium castaneum]
MRKRFQHFSITIKFISYNSQEIKNFYENLRRDTRKRVTGTSKEYKARIKKDKAKKAAAHDKIITNLHNTTVFLVK